MSGLTGLIQGKNVNTVGALNCINGLIQTVSKDGIERIDMGAMNAQAPLLISILNSSTDLNTWFKNGNAIKLI